MESKQENQEMDTCVPKRLVFRLSYSENIHLKNELRESGFCETIFRNQKLALHLF